MHLAIIAQAGTQGGGGGFLGFLPFILILVIIYFLMLRPQMKKQKEHSSMLASLRKNDDVVTAGGLHGRIVHIGEKDPQVQLLLAKGIVVTVERSSIARIKEARGSAPTQQISAGSEQPAPPSKREEPALAESRSGGTEAGVVTSGAPGGESRRSRSRRSRSRRHPPRGGQPGGQKQS